MLSIETMERTVKHDDAHSERVFNEKAVTEAVAGLLTVGVCLPRGTKYAGPNAVVDLSPIVLHIGANVGTATVAVDDLGTYLL